MYSVRSCIVTYVYLNAYISEEVNMTGEGEELMISYIVGRNFGHLNRAVATIEKFYEINNEKIRIYTFPHSFSWIKKNIPNVELDYFKKYKEYERLHKEMSDSSLILHDWRPEVAKLKTAGDEYKGIIGGIYHSELMISEDDDSKTRHFKELVRETANHTTDIFFHINLYQPTVLPKLSTLYVPIPLVTREITMNKNEVKEILGLSHDEPFVLIQMGGGVGPSKYKFIAEWYEKINHLRLPMRIVVAHQFEGLDFPFREDIIQAPLFYNGINLVNAAELVISKPGMGILSDAITTKTPLLLLPPDDEERKAKHDLLRKIVKSEIGTIEPSFSPKDLQNRIEEILDEKTKIEETFGKVPHHGADIIAQAIQVLCGKPLKELPLLYDEVLKLTPYSV